MNKSVKIFVLSCLILSTGNSVATNLPPAVVTKTGDAIYRIDRTMAITSETLLRHNIDVRNFADQNFEDFKFPSNAKGQDHMKQKALQDAMKGYLLLARIKHLLLDCIIQNCCRSENRSPRDVLLGAASTLDAKNMNIPWEISYQFFEAQWILLTGKPGFSLQTLANRAEQNNRFIQSLEARKAVLDPNLDHGTISRLDTLIKKSDLTAPLLTMYELEYCLGGFINSIIDAYLEPQETPSVVQPRE